MPRHAHKKGLSMICSNCPKSGWRACYLGEPDHKQLNVTAPLRRGCVAGLGTRLGASMELLSTVKHSTTHELMCVAPIQPVS